MANNTLAKFQGSTGMELWARKHAYVHLELSMQASKYYTCTPTA